MLENLNLIISIVIGAGTIAWVFVEIGKQKQIVANEIEHMKLLSQKVDVGFKRLDEIREKSISQREKIENLAIKFENLNKTFMTDREVEAKYLQKEIFEREMKRIDEKFNHLEKKLDEKFYEVNIALQEILKELKK